MCDPFEDRDPDLLFPVATEPDAVPNSGEACSKFSRWGKEGRKDGGREGGRQAGTVLIFTLLRLCGGTFLPSSDRGSKMGGN